MTLNTTGYLIYLPITVYITVIVGRSFHKNGIFYIQSVFKEPEIAHSINNLLLIGYYLVNIGYAFISIKMWIHIESLSQLIEEISLRTAYIILLLTMLHYINMLSIFLWKHLQKKININ